MQRRNSWVWLLVLILLAALGRYLYGQNGPAVGSTGECGDKFAYGRPAVQGEGENAAFLCRLGYAALHDPDLKVSLYAAEHLTRQGLDGDVPRTDDFQPDPDLPPGQRAELTDYRGSGYDRGHLAPAADFTDDPREMDQSFYLSNMVPQNGPMNEGIWAGLEAAVRACARSTGELYVLTGPVFAERFRTVGPDRVAVPSALYKVVLQPASGQFRSFLLPNRALRRTSNYGTYEVTLTQVEQRTGLTFFPQGQLDKSRPGGLCTEAFGS